MKLQIKVGAHDVSVEATPLEHGAIRFVAKAGDHERAGVMSIHAENYHDYTDEQLQANIDDFATRLAKEVAGHAQHSKLLARLFPQSWKGSPQ